jgi:hypothetical protein
MMRGFINWIKHKWWNDGAGSWWLIGPMLVVLFRTDWHAIWQLL